GPNGFISNLQNPVINNVTAVNAGLYTLSATVNNCTSIPANYTVEVNPGIADPVINSNSPICEGQSINLGATAIAGVTYNWTGPVGYSSTAQNPVISNALIANAGLYTVTA